MMRIESRTLGMLYTAKNATDLLQFVNFTGLLQLVNKLLQACHLQLVTTCLNNLRQAC